MLAEAIMIACIYVMPFVALITLGAFIMENVIPYIARRKARKARHEFDRQIHR